MTEEVSCSNCCKEPEPPTPEEIFNRPGLSAIEYRVGTYSTFLKSMQRDISSNEKLRDVWTVREPCDDYGIAFLKMWACLADILAFYQERIANEAFLRTAIMAESVWEMARFLEYKPAPGVAAEVYPAFTIEKGKEVEIPAGLRIQSVPIGKEKPQKFETAQPLLARWQLNRLRVHPRKLQAIADKNPLRASSTEGMISPLGEPTISPGDKVLFFGIGEIEEKEITAVTKDEMATIIAWTPGIASEDKNPSNSKAVKFGRKYRVFGYNIAASSLQSYLDKKGNLKWREVLEDFHLPADDRLCLDATYDDIKKGEEVLISIKTAGLYPLYGLSTGSGYLYSMNSSEISEGIQAKSAHERAQIVAYMFLEKRTDTMPLYLDAELQSLKGHYSSERPPILGYVYRLKKPGTVPLIRLKSEKTGEIILTVEKKDKKAIEFIRLNNEIDKRFAGPRESIKESIAGYVFAGPIAEYIKTTVRSTSLVAKQRGTISITVTEIALNDPILPIENLRDVEVYKLEGRAISFSEYYYPSAIEGDTIYMQKTQINELTPGRILILDDSALSPFKAEVYSSRENADSLEVKLKSRLERSLDSGSAVIYGNVVLATQGESVKEEILGDGDTSTALQSFSLAKSPLTHLFQRDKPRGVGSTLEVRANGILWQEASSFYGRGSEERIYIASQNSDGTTVVSFGNGINGSKLPSGFGNITAKYRRGLGSAGNVAAGTLTQLMDRPAGLKGVTNPISGGGGADPESINDVKTNASNTVRTFDRVVSLRDFEDAARECQGIAKAKAVRKWDGQAQIVSLTVVGPNGTLIGEDALKNLKQYLDFRRDANRKLKIQNFIPIRFSIKAEIAVKEDYLAEKVLGNCIESIGRFFSPNNMELGQAVNLSDVYRAIHCAEGLKAANVLWLDVGDSPAEGIVRAKTRIFLAADELAVIKDIKIIVNRELAKE